VDRETARRGPASTADSPLPRGRLESAAAGSSGRGVAFTNEEHIMQWVDPAFCDIRLGFEVTAYVYVR
jgi:pyrroloquinoline quinone biosynthesis protein A